MFYYFFYLTYLQTHTANLAGNLTNHGISSQVVTQDAFETSIMYILQYRSLKKLKSYGKLLNISIKKNNKRNDQEQAKVDQKNRIILIAV